MMNTKQFLDTVEKIVIEKSNIHAHIVPPNVDLLDAYIDRTPVEALCGHVFIPTYDPDKFPDCGECRKHYPSTTYAALVRRGQTTERTCSIDGCENKHCARGWCSSHYARWRAHGDVREDIPIRRRKPRTGDVCSVENCERPYHARGHCRTHYDIGLTRRRAERPMPPGIHGTHNGYKNWHCRCSACTQAATEGAREYRRRKDS